MTRKLLTPRWILTTLLVLAAAGVMVRLGIWQLDRLAQRRAFNARVNAVIDAPPLDLNQAGADAGLYDMEYRSVVARGHYDFSQQVGLRNQAYQDQIGIDLLTPLVIDGTNTAVLVERGWIPLADAATPEAWRKFDQPGEVTVRGMIRRPQTRPDFGGVPDPTLAPGAARLELWNIVNLERIRTQVSEPLLDVYVQAAPQAGSDGPPYPSLPTLDLTEGPHMGYALQWFTFAAILLAGYPFFVRRQLKPPAPAGETLVGGKNGHPHAVPQEGTPFDGDEIREHTN